MSSAPHHERSGRERVLEAQKRFFTESRAVPVGSRAETIVEALRPMAITPIAGPPENDSDRMAEGRRPALCPARPGKAEKQVRPSSLFDHRSRRRRPTARLVTPATRRQNAVKALPSGPLSLGIRRKTKTEGAPRVHQPWQAGLDSGRACGPTVRTGWLRSILLLVRLYPPHRRKQASANTTPPFAPRKSVKPPPKKRSYAARASYSP